MNTILKKAGLIMACALPLAFCGCSSDDDENPADRIAEQHSQIQLITSQYPNQVINPYTDMVQHRLYMKNGIHGSWCRTTPLWGRGLSQANTGADDRLHDCRARNEIEAIMWHGYNRKSEAFTSTERFYNLAKDDRDAIVKFIRSI